MSFSASVRDLIEASNSQLVQRADRWPRTDLATIATVLNGFPFKSDHFNSSRGSLVIRIRDVTSGRAKTFYDGPPVEGYWVEPGELVVGMDGDFNSRIWSSEQALLNQRVCKIIPNERAMDRRFLAYLLPGYLRVVNEATHSVTVKHLSSKTIQELPLSLPPLAEQQRIVAKLDALTARTARAGADLDRIPALALLYREAVLKKAYDEATDCALGLPSLGDVSVHFRNGLSRKPEHSPPGLSILKISAIRPMNVRTSEQRYYVPAKGENTDHFQLRLGDLLFIRFNGNPELVGACGMLRDMPPEGLLYPDKLILVRLDHNQIAPDFAEMIIASPAAREQLYVSVKSAAGQHGISGQDLKLLRIPLPPLEVQNSIIRRVDHAFAEIDRLTTQATSARRLLDRLDQAILAKAFRGELVPQDPADEPASDLLARLKADRRDAPKPKRGRKPKAA